ncbi:hypothetical protein GCM10009075_41190 [Sphingomonas trueperi]
MTLSIMALSGCHGSVPRLANCADAQNIKLIVERCYQGDLNTGHYVGDTVCFPFSKTERIAGFWYTDLEASYFGSSPSGARKAMTWLKVNNEPQAVTESMRGERPREFAVTFEGRRSLCPGSFGHMGMTSREIVVERLISMAPIPPGQ